MQISDVNNFLYEQYSITPLAPKPNRILLSYFGASPKSYQAIISYLEIWILAIGYWLLNIGYWILTIGYFFCMHLTIFQFYELL
jgi:hypothetical protein